MKFSIHKEIAPNVFTASEASSLGQVVIVHRIEDDYERLTELTFSSFIQQFSFDKKTFFHLHGCLGDERLFSVIFDSTFSQHIEFELCFDSITAEKNGELKGVIGTVEFYGVIQANSLYNTISVIPVKYKRIVRGKQLYIAAFNGIAWDIYDNSHYERTRQIQETNFGDYELTHPSYYNDPDKDHYYCLLEYEYSHKENPYKELQFVISRVLLSKIKEVSTSTDEPYPVSDSGAICLIGCPRYSDKYEYDTVSEAWRELGELFPKYSYIVSRGGKKGLWYKNAIVRSKMEWIGPYYPPQKCDYYGHGYELLACDYLDIIPNHENLLDGGINEPLGVCNSFSIKCKSGWGVYDVVRHRTVLTPVFDGPVEVIIGPEGYIGSIRGKYGIVDKDGNIVFPFIYDKISINDVELRHFEDGWSIRTDVQLELEGSITFKRFVFKH